MDFKDTMRYNHWCNSQVIALFTSNPKQYNGRLAVLMSHSLNAHAIWNQRIQASLETQPVWTVHPLEHLEVLEQSNYENSLAILEARTVREQLTYSTTSGERYTNQVSEVLFHIINHSTYHRGQLMSGLKSQGITPVATDYIVYKR